MIVAVIIVLVTHHQHALKDLTFKTARIELLETARAVYSDISLFLHQVTSVGPYRIQYLDCYCNHRAGNTSPACFKVI